MFNTYFSFRSRKPTDIDVEMAGALPELDRIVGTMDDDSGRIPGQYIPSAASMASIPTVTAPTISEPLTANPPTGNPGLMYPNKKLVPPGPPLYLGRNKLGPSVRKLRLNDATRFSSGDGTPREGRQFALLRPKPEAPQPSVTTSGPSSLKRRKRLEYSREDEGVEEFEGNSMYQPYQTRTKVRIIPYGNMKENEMVSKLEAQELELTEVRKALTTALDEKAVVLDEKAKIELELANVSVQLEQVTKTGDSVEVPVVQGTNPTHDDIRSFSEEVERLKQETGFLRGQLASANREAEAAHSQRRNIESCVIGWRDRFREQELLVGKIREEFQQALVEERENALQQTTTMNTERDDAVEETERLKTLIGNVERERDQAMQALGRQDEEDKQALLDVQNQINAQIDSLKEAHRKEKEDTRTAHQASIQEAIEHATSEMNKEALGIAEGLKQQIEGFQRERDQAIEALQSRDKEHEQALRDYDARITLLKADHDKEKITRDDFIEDAVQKATTAVNKERDEAIEVVKALEARLEMFQCERDQAVEALAKKDEDHHQALSAIRREHDTQTTLLKETYEKEKTSRDEDAVQNATTIANKERDEAIETAKALEHHLEACQRERDLASEALEKRDKDHQRALDDLRQENDAHTVGLKETLDREKATREDSIQNAVQNATERLNKERDEAIDAAKALQQRIETCQHERDDSVKTLRRQNEDHKQAILNMKNSIEEQRATMLKDAQEKEVQLKADFDRGTAEFLRQKAQEVSNVRAEMQQIIDENKKKLELEHQRVERLQADLALLREGQLPHSPQARDSNGDINMESPAHSSSNTGNRNMEPGLSEKAQGKQPESPHLARVNAAMPNAKQNTRFRSTTGYHDRRSLEPVPPPMRFTRPFGADTPLADRLRMPTPTPPVAPRSRAQTPVHSSRRSRPSIFETLHRSSPTPTPGPSAPNLPRTGSPTVPRSSTPSAGAQRASSPLPNFAFGGEFGFNFSTTPTQPEARDSTVDPMDSSGHMYMSPPPRDGTSAGPAFPPSSGSIPTANHSVPDPGHSTTSGPSSSGLPGGDNSFRSGENATSHQSCSNLLQEIASGMVSELKSIRGEILESRKLFTSPRRKSRIPEHGDFVTKTPPRPRTANRTALMSAARGEMNSLLQIGRDSDIMQIIQDAMVGADEVELYMDGTKDAPPLEPLRPYWDVLQSSWNHHLAKLFAEHFVAHYPEVIAPQGVPEVLKEVADYFIQRLETLRKIVQKNLPQHPNESAEAIATRVAAQAQASRATKRRRARQERRFEARLKITSDGTAGSTGTAWKILLAMVNFLGLDGNSSDETDGERHTVRIKEWRSAEVKNLLEFIDANRKTTNALGTRISGVTALIRDRKAYGPPSTKTAVAGLPLNFYNRAWYDSLSEIEQFQLGATDVEELPVVNE